jgi:serine/threonine protein kinase/Tfp pilus assembly protein PilF
MSIIGRTIGHIHIVNILGGGGMGDVYTGFDDKLKRKVAVKAIRAKSRLNPQAKSRFLREARVLSQLEHANICQIYDYIEDKDIDYLILEFISGKNLNIAIREGLSKQLKMKIAEQIAEVLAVAHEKGIVHRDLKPSNVMLTESNEAKVLDFGLARYVKAGDQKEKTDSKVPGSEKEDFRKDNEGLPGEIDVTQTFHYEEPQILSDTDRPLHATLTTKDGTIMGTPSYMSPEQARGESIGAASDMYSFGLILQQLFTEKAPYDETADRSTVLKMAKEAETMPPTGISSDLSGLINRLKSPIPTARPSATETLETLQKIREKPRRRTRNLLITAVVLAFIILGLKYVLDLRRERRQAFQARDEATEVANFLVDLFEVSDPGEARGNTITAREILDTGARKIEQGLERQPLTKARLMETIGIVYHKLGLYPESEPLVKTALQIREKVLGKDDLQVSQSLMSLALLLVSRGKYSEAAECARRSLEIREKKLGADHPDFADSLHVLARIYQLQSEEKKARSLYERALEIRERALGSNNVKVADSLFDLGRLCYIENEFDKSEEFFQRSLKIRESTLGPDHPDVAQSLNGLAGLYLWLRRYDEAEPLYQRALAIRQKTLGPNHPDVAVIYYNIAILHLYKKDYSEAEKYYKKNLETLKKSLRNDHPDIAGTLHSLANIYKITGRTEEAEEMYQQAYSLLEKAYGPDNPELVGALHNLGFIFMEKGDFTKAEENMKRAISIMEKAYGPDHPRLAYSWRNLGQLHLKSGSLEESERNMKKALSILEKSVDPDDGELAGFLSDLGHLYCVMEKYEEAEKQLLRGLQVYENIEIPKSETKADILRYLGKVYYRGFKEYEKAESCFSEAMKLYEEQIGLDSAAAHEAVREYADLLRKTGRQDQAADLEEKIKPYG